MQYDHGVRHNGRGAGYLLPWVGVISQGNLFCGLLSNFLQIDWNSLPLPSPARQIPPTGLFMAAS